LRKAGATYANIAAQTIKKFSAANLPKGYDERQAHQDVVRELDKLNSFREETAIQVLDLELARLDALLMACWAQAKSGHLGAIDRALRVLDRRAKLLGLDAPHKMDITSAGEKIEIVEVISPNNGTDTNS